MEVGASNGRSRAPVGVRRLMTPHGWTAGAIVLKCAHTDAHKSHIWTPDFPGRTKCAGNGAVGRHNARLLVKDGHLARLVMCPGRGGAALAMPPSREEGKRLQAAPRGTTQLILAPPQGRQPQVRTRSIVFDFLAESFTNDLYPKPQPLAMSNEKVPADGRGVKCNGAYCAGVERGQIRARRGAVSLPWLVQVCSSRL